MGAISRMRPDTDISPAGLTPGVRCCSPDQPILSLCQFYGVGITLILLVKKLRLTTT